jgi:hypothetical protein
LTPGSSKDIEILTKIDASFTGLSLVNRSEISKATNSLNQPDIDSSPDANLSNDAGGNPNSPSDNSLNGNGNRCSW